MLRAIRVLAAVAAITLVLIPVQWISVALKLPSRRSIPVLYHRMLCALIGIRIREVGERVREHPLLVVANHCSWLDVPVRWKGMGRRPIPPEWQRMPLRFSLLGDRNRNATHPVMAALNYAFGVPESQVRTAALQAGLDPTVGYHPRVTPE